MKYTSRHIEKVIRIIEDDGVAVRRYKRSALDSSANCYSPMPSIKLGVDDYKYLVIAALVHEYGHCKSVKISRAGGTKCLPMLIAIYNNENNPWLEQEEKAAIIREERRAWRLGFKLLRDNGIAVDKKMLYFRQVCVEAHIKRLAQDAGSS
jgi:hypothetical protein